MKNYILFFTLMFVSVCSLFASPMVPWAVEKEQPDGTKISVFLKGDENVSWADILRPGFRQYDASLSSALERMHKTLTN